MLIWFNWLLKKRIQEIESLKNKQESKILNKYLEKEKVLINQDLRIVKMLKL